jgi:hypothetical protein
MERFVIDSNFPSTLYLPDSGNSATADGIESDDRFGALPVGLIVPDDKTDEETRDMPDASYQEICQELHHTILHSRRILDVAVSSRVYKQIRIRNEKLPKK